jgi:hypothetical protein
MVFFKITINRYRKLWGFSARIFIDGIVNQAKTLTKTKWSIQMKRLSTVEKSSTNKLSAILQERLNESPVFVNKIQEDNETGASLCEIEFSTKKALVWVRSNGSASSVSGVRLLLAGGRYPKNNPSISCFTQNI